MKSTDADTFISCGLFPNWGGRNSFCGWAIDAKARSGKRSARADGLDVPKDAQATLTPTSRIRILGTALSHKGPNHARADWFGPAPYPANPIPSHNGTRQLRHLNCDRELLSVRDGARPRHRPPGAPHRKCNTPNLDISPHTPLASRPRLPTTGITHPSLATGRGSNAPIHFSRKSHPNFREVGGLCAL